MILEKIASSVAFNLTKQNVTDLSFIHLTQNFVLCHQVTTARHCKLHLRIVSTVAYQTLVAHQCPLTLPSRLLDIQLHQTAIFNSR